MTEIHRFHTTQLKAVINACDKHMFDIDFYDKQDDAFLTACPRESAELIKKMFDKVKVACENFEFVDGCAVKFLDVDKSVLIGACEALQTKYRVLTVKWGAYTLLKRTGSHDGLKSLYENHVKDAEMKKHLPEELVVRIEHHLGLDPSRRHEPVKTNLQKQTPTADAGTPIDAAGSASTDVAPPAGASQPAGTGGGADTVDQEDAAATAAVEPKNKVRGRGRGTGSGRGKAPPMKKRKT
jgi:hypothetical protein